MPHPWTGLDAGRLRLTDDATEQPAEIFYKRNQISVRIPDRPNNGDIVLFERCKQYVMNRCQGMIGGGARCQRRRIAEFLSVDANMATPQCV